MYLKYTIANQKRCLKFTAECSTGQICKVLLSLMVSNDKSQIRETRHLTKQDVYFAKYPTYFLPIFEFRNFFEFLSLKKSNCLKNTAHYHKPEDISLPK